MATINPSAIEGESSLSAYRWNSVSPRIIPITDDASGYCRQIKIEHPFEMDKEQYYATTSPAANNPRGQPTMTNSGMASTAIPLASCATAAASISSAFSKRPAVYSKTPLNSPALIVDEAQSAVVLDGTPSKCLEILTTDGTDFRSDQTICDTSGIVKAEQSSIIRNRETYGAVTHYTSPSAAEEAAADCNLSSTTSCGDGSQVDIYRDLILRHLIQDITATCTRLSLPPDLYAWSSEQSARWISDTCLQFQLTPPRQLFLPGRILLSMSQEEFIARSPDGGDTLFAQLQLWKTAFDSCNSQNGSNPCAPQPLVNSRTSNVWINSNASSHLNIAPNTDHVANSQEYLGNFNSNGPLNTPINCTQGMVPHDGNTSGPTQQTFYSASLGSSTQILPSPTDSDASVSSIAESNDGNNGDAASSTVSQFPRTSSSVHLWHFIRELLDHPKQYASCVRWVDRIEGTFKIESSHHLARFWGQRKNRSQMNYDKLSRSLRQYYKKGIIQKPEKKQRLVYKFLPPYNL